jgi:eukaryotic-like serine/threonine-protein kinase
MVPIGAVLSGRFRVRRLVAKGGMASVYEVEDGLTRRLGALKLLQPRYAASPDAVERMIREASAAARIANPHIVEMFDAGRLDTGEPFIFMELLEGEALDATIARRGRLSFAEAANLVGQAASAIAVVHDAGVLHRDLKPSNLFLVGGDEPFLKVLDFGVSKFFGSGFRTLTKEGSTLGTFAYMPPEQMMAAKRVDARADIYALAVVLYECVVGALPFRANSIPELNHLKLKNEHVRVSQLRADTPPAFDALLERALRADPHERFSTMSELGAQLARVFEQSVVQRSVSAGKPDDTFSGQNRERDTLGSRVVLAETIVPRSLKKRP